MPTSLKTLEKELGVKAVLVDDPTQTADFVVIVGKSTDGKKAPAGG